MRTTLVTLLLVILGVVLPSPISASAGAGSPALQAVGGPDLITRAAPSGIWDPDDVEGRFDLRWIGAAYTSSGEIHLSLSFYDGFDWRLLNADKGYVTVWLSDALNGYFVRRPGGRLVFEWGDFGSTCCARARATRPSSNVISVTFDPCSYVWGNGIDRARGESLWRTRHIRALDSTGVIDLAHPSCDRAT